MPDGTDFETDDVTINTFIMLALNHEDGMVPIYCPDGHIAGWRDPERGASVHYLASFDASTRTRRTLCMIDGLVAETKVHGEDGEEVEGA